MVLSLHFRVLLLPTGRTLHSLLGIPVVNLLSDLGSMMSGKAMARLATMDVLIIVSVEGVQPVMALSQMPSHT
jgi:hypothetical protein